MPIAETRVETERPGRYLVQLCRHFSHKGRHLGQRSHGGHRGADPRALREMRAVAEQARVEWSESEGDIVLAWGQIALRTEPGALLVRIDAVGDEELRRLQELLAGHVERFGRREGLRVSWQPSESGPAAAAAAAADDDGDGRAGRRRVRIPAAGLVAVVVLVLAVHLGFGAVLLENWQWTGWAVGGVLAVVLMKVVVLGGFAFRRGRVARNR